MTEDYYAALGLDRSATPAQIKAKYRQLSKSMHPDKHQSSATPEEMAVIVAKFQAVVRAYSVLGDKQSRGIYDEYAAQRDDPDFFIIETARTMIRAEFAKLMINMTLDQLKNRNLIADIKEWVITQKAGLRGNFTTLRIRLCNNKEVAKRLKVSEIGRVTPGCMDLIELVRSEHRNLVISYIDMRRIRRVYAAMTRMLLEISYETNPSPYGRTSRTNPTGFLTFNI